MKAAQQVIPLVGELYPGTYLRRRYSPKTGKELTPVWEGPPYIITDGKRLRNAEDIACEEADSIGLCAVVVYGLPYGKVGAEWYGWVFGNSEKKAITWTD